MLNTTVPIEAFNDFIRLPENRERSFELIAGEIVEKMVSSPRSSAIGMRIGAFITLHVIQGDLGRTSGADGGYWVAGERYIPDVGFIAKARQAEFPTEAYNPLAPDLAVEVLSPTNEDEAMRIKIVNYLLAGTTVWLIDPDDQRLEVYTPGQPPRILRVKDTLDGGDALPGFTLKVGEIFA